MKTNLAKILMLLESNFPGDSRVKNEAYALRDAGYTVTVIALKKRGEKAKEVVNGVTVYRARELELFKKTSEFNVSSFIKIVQNLKSVLGYAVEHFYVTFRCLILSLRVLKNGGTFYFSVLIRGRSRGFRLASSPNRPAVRRCHLAVPNGVPRFTLWRRGSTSAPSVGC